MEYQVYADYFNLASQLVKSKSFLFIILFSLFIFYSIIFLGGRKLFLTIYIDFLSIHFEVTIKWLKEF